MKRIANGLIIFLITLILFSVVLEIAYRYQVIDFYKPELNGLNTSDQLQSNKKKILVCGDSFTADPFSFVKTIRDSLPNYAVINAAVPGTGILQQKLFMERRAKKFSPDIFIYQFYVGNDLFDISHPSSSKQISWIRSMYWWLSDRMLSLAFLNYRFAGIRYQFYDDGGGSYKPKEKEAYSSVSYSKREKLNYLADPMIFENTLFLKGGREHDFERFKKEFKDMISNFSPSTKIYVVVIPHQSQLSQTFFDRHQSMGCTASVPYYNYKASQLPIYKKMEELCQENHLTLIDPLQIFKESIQQEEIYYSNDPHLKRKGHDIIGQLLLDDIRKESTPDQK